MGAGRILIILGATLLILGLLWPWLSQIGLGRLPGDIVIERETFRLYIPITSSLIVSRDQRPVVPLSVVRSLPRMTTFTVSDS